MPDDEVLSCRAKIRCHRMKVPSLSVNFVMATTLLVASPLLRAQDGVQGAFEQACHTVLSAQWLNPGYGPTLAVADFDGDK